MSLKTNIIYHNCSKAQKGTLGLLKTSQVHLDVVIPKKSTNSLQIDLLVLGWLSFCRMQFSDHKTGLSNDNTKKYFFRSKYKNKTV